MQDSELCTLLSAYFQPDTRHDAELAAQLADELAEDVEGPSDAAHGFRSDPGAGASNAPPSSGLRAPAERRGAHKSAGFDALREARFASEVPSTPRKLFDTWRATFSPVVRSLDEVRV